MLHVRLSFVSLTTLGVASTSVCSDSGVREPLSGHPVSHSRASTFPRYVTDKMVPRNALQHAQRAVVFFCSVFNNPEYGGGIRQHFRARRVKVFFV
jgi:hypothetical protein